MRAEVEQHSAGEAETRKRKTSTRSRMGLSALYLMALTKATRGFVVSQRNTKHVALFQVLTKDHFPIIQNQSKKPTKLHATRDRKETRSEEELAPQQVTAEWDVVSSDYSLGSLLETMNKQSEEALSLFKHANNSTSAEVEELAPIKPSKDKELSEKDKEPNKKEEESQSEEVASANPVVKKSVDQLQTARQLDASISATRRAPSIDILTSDLQILPLGSLYSSRTRGSIPTFPWMRQPEQYLDRMDRDRRHLAVSIAASVMDEVQWRAFCEERGGLYPILQTIREGARAIISHQQRGKKKLTYLLRPDDVRREESFRAACSACRAIRDLCTISPDMAAVITDGMLRANAAWNGNLMNDFHVILQYAKEYTAAADSAIAKRNPRFLLRFRSRRDTRLRCKLYVTQLLLELTIASDDAVAAIRSSPDLMNAIVDCSSYAPKQQTKRWIRYPGEIVKWLWRRTTRRSKREPVRPPFIEAVRLSNDLLGQVQRCSNQILAAAGYNKWVPKIPGQQGLRILALDGGGSRGMVAVKALEALMAKVGNGRDVSDSFDMIVGTSTGGIIAFLVGLQQETSKQAVERYEGLISKIFIKSTLSTPLMLFTTASYDESHFMKVLENILKENSMLDSRADPSVPYVCALSSKMSSTPTHVALFRNYNYACGEQKDPFVVDPEKARENLDLPLSMEHTFIRKGTYSSRQPQETSAKGSRHPGSFRVLQRYALRASTAAPTIFKPVLMGGEMYCDGGIVASNPTAVAIHEARSLFPDIPIELVVSVGTGLFHEQKSPAKVGWDGIIGQIVNSATESEQVHHILEDLVGESAFVDQSKGSMLGNTRYFRFNPTLGYIDEFPIDVTEPAKLVELQKISQEYMAQPEQQHKIMRISEILKGKK